MGMVAKTLFRNANLVLDGFAELQKSFDVLVQGNRILSVSQTPLDHADANVMDIRGRTLMPVSSMRMRI
jgi:imidazolonepropionase-like amidohydrolase